METPLTALVGGYFFDGDGEVPRPSSCLPLTREVANPEGLTEGEIR